MNWLPFFGNYLNFWDFVAVISTNFDGNRNRIEGAPLIYKVWWHVSLIVTGMKIVYQRKRTLQNKIVQIENSQHCNVSMQTQFQFISGCLTAWYWQMQFLWMVYVTQIFKMIFFNLSTSHLPLKCDERQMGKLKNLAAIYECSIDCVVNVTTCAVLIAWRSGNKCWAKRFLIKMSWQFEWGKQMKHSNKMHFKQFSY